MSASPSSRADCAVAAPPLISVLIPAYHPPGLVRRCLQSVAAQTEPLEHVVLVDDASPYDLSALPAEFPGVRFERNARNLGIAANWNRCLAEAQGAYVTFLHSDDELAPDWHARWRPILQSADPAVNLFCSGSLIVNDAGTPLWELGLGETFWCEAFPRNLQRLWDRFCFGLPFSAALLYRRSFLERAGGFPAQDYPHNADVYLNLGSLFDTRLAYCPAPLFRSRRHGGQSVCQSDVDAARVAAAVFHRLAQERASMLRENRIDLLRRPLSVYFLTAAFQALRGDWARWRAYRAIGLSGNPRGWLSPWTWGFLGRFLVEQRRRVRRARNRRV